MRTRPRLSQSERRARTHCFRPALVAVPGGPDRSSSRRRRLSIALIARFHSECQDRFGRSCIAEDLCKWSRARAAGVQGIAGLRSPAPSGSTTGAGISTTGAGGGFRCSAFTALTNRGAIRSRPSSRHANHAQRGRAVMGSPSIALAPRCAHWSNLGLSGFRRRLEPNPPVEVSKKLRLS
jgi:hypothetical protein